MLSTDCVKLTGEYAVICNVIIIAITCSAVYAFFIFLREAHEKHWCSFNISRWCIRHISSCSIVQHAQVMTMLLTTVLVTKRMCTMCSTTADHEKYLRSVAPEKVCQQHCETAACHYTHSSGDWKHTYLQHNWTPCVTVAAILRVWRRYTRLLTCLLKMWKPKTP